MKKRVTAILLLTVVLLGILAGCKKEEALDADGATKIAVKHLGATEKEGAAAHVHIEENDAGEICYSVYITVSGKSYTCLIHAGYLMR